LDSSLHWNDKVGEKDTAGAESLDDEGFSHGAEGVADVSTVEDTTAVEESPAFEPVRRRSLFGRRQWVAEDRVAEEPVAEAVGEPPVTQELAVETLIEAPVAEEFFAPVFEHASPELAGPVVDEAVAVEPPADELVVDEPVAVELVVEEPVADELVVDEPVAVELVVEEPVADEPVVEAVIEEPARRRGLFGRRQRGDVGPVAVEPVAVEEPVDEQSHAEGEFAPVAEAPVPEPIVAPAAEPAPVAAVYFATAIDILPGRAMGRRGKHATLVPTNASAESPAAPAAYTATAPVAPVVAPPVRAGLPQRDLSAVAPSAPPLQASDPMPAPSARTPIEPSPFEYPGRQVPVQHGPVEPAAVEHAPAEVDQPTASAAMSELDQLALNAELQKSALSELRSLYEPAHQGAAPAADAAGLVRPQRRVVEPVVESGQLPEAPTRERDAVQVRGMLSGFRAGVERGRTATTEEAQDVERADTAMNDASPANATPTDTTTN